MSYNFENGENILPIYTDEPEKVEGIYIYKTFYFKALSTDITIPNIVVYLKIDDFSPIKKEILSGKKIKVIKLNPPENYCNVIAKNLEVKNFQALQYDKEKNLIIMDIDANLSNLEDFHLNFVEDEKIEDFNRSATFSKMTYFAKIPKDMKNFEFSYFNNNKNVFEKFKKFINVKDETVSTQSDIKPNESSHKNIKIIILLSIAVIFLIIAIFKKSIFSILIALLFAGYATYLAIPLEEVCVKQDSEVRLLPTKNSTIFYKTDANFKTKKLNQVNGYIKIELPNGKIGWVKDENICQN
ncbi:hypothetical protein [Nitrosophilus kaiyonis]|uniref:hypothetical protein n=1 Tax=Nitrosophilus kaiyonis TaxID=2930200 RepID=UPI002491B351|nr:hypothetical protein [Nitrosophilus kaiyonis]